MTSEQRPRDLEDTDVYEVGMAPVVPPAPPEPADRPTPTAPAPAPAQSWIPAAPRAPMTGPGVSGNAPPLAPLAPVSQTQLHWQQQPPRHAAAPYRDAPYDTSGLAILAATTLLVFGVVGVLLFALLLAIWESVARLSLGTVVRLETVESTRIVMITLLIVALVQVVASIGVFAHRAWARLIGLAISVPGTVLGTLLLVAAASRGLTLEMWLAAVLLGGYGLSFFGLVAGNSHFRRMARRW